LISNLTPYQAGLTSATAAAATISGDGVATYTGGKSPVLQQWKLYHVEWSKKYRIIHYPKLYTFQSNYRLLGTIFI
jgi:hypothetical protein